MKCKKGSNSLDLIHTKSKTYADCKNMYPLNEIRVDAATHKLLLSRKYQNARFMVQAKALNFTKKLKLTPSLSPPSLSLSYFLSLKNQIDSSRIGKTGKLAFSQALLRKVIP